MSDAQAGFWIALVNAGLIVLTFVFQEIRAWRQRRWDLEDRAIARQRQVLAEARSQTLSKAAVTKVEELKGVVKEAMEKNGGAT